MNVVELLERLRAQGIELVWFDRFGPVWSGGRPPAEAEPWIELLRINLEYAVRGAGTGHVWGACDKCGAAQLVPKKDMSKERGCKLTPHCSGHLGRYVDLPTAREGWATLKATRKLALARKRGPLGLPKHQGRVTGRGGHAPEPSGSTPAEVAARLPEGPAPGAA